MNLKPLLFVAALMLVSCSSPGRPQPLSSTGSGVATEGTLANDQLTRDATAEVHKIAGGTGAITKFLIQQPVGPKGKKAWREMWIYDPQNRPRAFGITFQEDGSGSASYAIEEMKTEPAKAVQR